MNNKIPLYCKCGGLVKTKPIIDTRHKNFIDFFRTDKTKPKNKYVCSKCGKVYK